MAINTQLQRGDTGDEVKKLQDYLVNQGLMTQAQVQTGYGTFGPQTERAVTELQKRLGVDTSGGGVGRFGPRTIQAVNLGDQVNKQLTSQKQYAVTQNAQGNYELRLDGVLQQTTGDLNQIRDVLKRENLGELDVNKIDTKANIVSPILSPQITPITNNIPAVGIVKPELPQTTFLDTNASYYASLTQQLADSQKALQTERDKQLATIQINRDNIQKELDTIRSDQKTAITDMGTAAAAEKKAKLDQLAIEQARFDENYNTVQGLASQLTDLMTQGNALITQQKEVTGLAAIRNPRVAQTMSDITAASGVIQAAISVYNGQMNQAQSQLKTATDVISSAYTNQLDYYKVLTNFYESKSSDTDKKLIELSKDERDFLDKKISLLENDVKRVQDNSDKLRQEFLDPDKALKFAKAGITINTPQDQWGILLEKEAYATELASQSKNMAEKGYTYLSSGIAPKGSISIQTVDSNGVVKNWYKKETAKEITTASKTQKFFDEKGNEISHFEAARSIIEANPNASEDELINAIRENVIDDKGNSLINASDVQRIVREKIKKRPSLTIEEIKQEIINTLEPQKNVFSRSEAKMAAENQLKSSLGLKSDQSLPKTYKNAVEDALVAVYGRTFFQRILPGGK